MLEPATNSLGVAEALGVRRALVERVKELLALHEAARLLQDAESDTTELLGRFAALLRPAFQCPETAVARGRYASVTAATSGYRDSPWGIEGRFRTRKGEEGAVEVRYLDLRPAAAEGPFLAEERHLIDSLVE